MSYSRHMPNGINANKGAHKRPHPKFNSNMGIYCNPSIKQYNIMPYGNPYGNAIKKVYPLKKDIAGLDDNIAYLGKQN